MIEAVWSVAEDSGSALAEYERPNACLYLLPSCADLLGFASSGSSLEEGTSLKPHPLLAIH